MPRTLTPAKAAKATPRRAASSGTAERFAARVRSRRRRRWAAGIAAILVLVGLGWLTLFSPWLLVERVEVSGTTRVDAGAVHQIADAELGRPMVLLDPRAVSDRVAALPLVKTVTVTRRWPSTVRVRVDERVPVAAVPAAPSGSSTNSGTNSGTSSAKGGYRLVDRDGVEVEAVSTRPVTLPYLDVDVATGGPAALTAALDVQSALPIAISDRLRSIGATSRDGVWLTMDNGARVVWGSAEDSAEKVDVLRALVTATPDAALYDVSAPGAPAVAKRTVRDPLVLTKP